jgi:hypothetical protein
MPRRIRRLLIALVLLVAVGLAAGFAVFAIRGSDAPPPPALSSPAPDDTASTPAPAGASTYEVVVGDTTFVGYRVREEFVTFGVTDAVGRTDESRRDNALRGRGIETDRFPTARFELTEPFELLRRAVRARGRLTLHGETRPIAARVTGQRTSGGAIELVGSAPIDFEDFAIEPPSVAGFVTVRDTGRLEFKLELAPH